MPVSSFITILPQTSSNNPGDPAGTASATAVMMNIGVSFTPSKSGKTLVLASGNVANGTIADGFTVDARYGTGTAPINGAAVTGTLIGKSRTAASPAAAEKTPFSINDIISLTPGTVYWFDLSLLAVTAGTATLTNISFTLVEFSQ